MKKQVYYINDNLEIRKGYISSVIKLKSDLEVIVERKGIKHKVIAENIADKKERLNEQIKKLQISREAVNRGLKPRWFGNILFIDSKIESQKWKCEIDEQDGRIIIWHSNKGNGRENFRFHYQRHVANFYHAIDSIASHNEYDINKYSQSNLMKVFELISTNNIPKMKLS